MNKEPQTNAELVAGLRKKYPKLNCLETLEKKMADLNPDGGYTIGPAQADAKQIKNSQIVVKEMAVKKVTKVNENGENNAKPVPHLPTVRIVPNLPTMRKVFTKGRLLMRHYVQWWMTYGNAAHNMPGGREYKRSEIQQWKWTIAVHNEKIEEAIAAFQNKAVDAVVLMMPIVKTDPPKVKESKPIVRKRKNVKKAKSKAIVKIVKKVIPKAITKEIVPSKKKAITEANPKVMVEQKDKKRKRTTKTIEDPLSESSSDFSYAN